MAKLLHICSHLPCKALTNKELSIRFQNWSPEKILAKTGIAERKISAEDETASDLAIKAGKKLLSKKIIDKNDIDMLIFVTQTPDRALPASACFIHQQLGLKINCGAFDINQGCSGYIYGLSIAKGIISSGEAKNVLLLTGDTYTKLLDPRDRSVATLFGDGASASLIGPDLKGEKPGIGFCSFGTNGDGAGLLKCDYGGWRIPKNDQKPLSMDGAGILTFTLSTLPNELNIYLEKIQKKIEDYDQIIFHQANQFILERLYSKLGIKEKGIIYMKDSGNTVSTTIPIALETLQTIKKSIKKKKILLAGFGVGLSWNFTDILF
tara:strand:+ start:2082 stop:3047 length:966 start_codon:yes stop_codon:yes gene_type:complete